MEHYVGLDVSLKLTSICVVNQTGSVVREGVVDSDPEAIAAFVRSNALVRIGLETGPTATWLWTELKRHLPVICVDVESLLPPADVSCSRSGRQSTSPADQGDPAVIRALKSRGFRTVLVVPMVKDMDVIGMINLGRTRMQPFTDKQIELIADFAAQAAIALEITRRERQYREVQNDCTRKSRADDGATHSLDCP